MNPKVAGFGMCRRLFVVFLVLSSAISVLFIHGAASGQVSTQRWNIDQGTSEREWTYERRPPVEGITFSWIPELDPQTTLYFVQARCDIDNKKANNKMVFKNVRLTGVASGNTVGVARISKAIRGGEGKSALWDLTSLIGEFQNDDIVLVSGKIRVKKRLKASQAITCSLSVWELFDADNLRTSTESERLRYFQEVIDNSERDPELALVPKTGQTTCFDAAGDVIDCSAGLGPGQDGAFVMGVQWPNPRFRKNGDGTVTDNLTGLIWLENANCADATMDWAAALAFANTLFDGSEDHDGDDCGLSDGSTVGAWRLPNVFELLSLMHYGVADPAVPNTTGTGKWVEGDPFSAVVSETYWSSTTYVLDSPSAFVVHVGGGHIEDQPKGWDIFLVWPVRGGQ